MPYHRPRAHIESLGERPTRKIKTLRPPQGAFPLPHLAGETSLGRGSGARLQSCGRRRLEPCTSLRAMPDRSSPMLLLVASLSPVLAQLDSSSGALAAATTTVTIGTAPNYWSMIPSYPTSYSVSVGDKLSFTAARMTST